MTNSPVPKEQFEQDRARLNELLGRAYADGRLDLVDYHELQDQLFSADDRAELARVSGRLPVQYRFGDPAGAVNDVALAPGQVNDPSAGPGGTSVARASLGLGLGIGAAVLAVVVLLLMILL
ncbi:DUF1707 domain-containing protein [uncultured Propionibacterium sp.]|uniref:DUF1707 SHOCT-like domain-containing protein n=1 Tax=uncultured Propionibacterium sp. TaxID=218066 RepID=UPI00293154AA|nr:DUF1707 domain-containing protein [uncultured Propionibacterium sp.]